MRSPAHRRLLTLAAPAALVAGLAGAGSCAPAPRATPPAAEFLVASDDSTYWVTSGAAGVHLRGAPLTLASSGGRYYELFVADDDRSFYDAVLVGQRLYRRDLLTGDSVVVLADSIIPGLAARYAASHPSADPLGADEEPSDDPELVANAEVELLDVVGPYANYEYHADVERVGGESRYTTRRGVVDWRTGRAVSLAALLGPAQARAVIAEGRRAFRAALDSVRRSRDPRAGDARGALRGFRFDDRSFAIAPVAGQLSVAFLAPGAGSDAGGLLLPLEPIPVTGDQAWWVDARSSLPEPAAGDSALDRWTRPAYGVLARYGGDSLVTLSLVDTARREWPVGRLGPPAARAFWLDRPEVDTTTRRALLRAFDESALYDENARLASLAPRRHRRASSVRVTLAAGRRGPDGVAVARGRGGRLH